ncbi:MAG: SLBB domain-containing protein [Deltaproteobacteria bacterium]|nr:SLBB domain-containing protein [Deltaproteobacteria bacterium]
MIANPAATIYPAVSLVRLLALSPAATMRAVTKRQERDSRLMASLARSLGVTPPAAGLRQLAEQTRTPLHRLHGLVSFFPHLQAQPDDAIAVCSDLSCRLAEPHLLETLQAAGKAARPCSCLGHCERPAALAMGGRIYTGVTTRGAADELTRAPTVVSPPGGECHRLDPYDGAAPYSQLRRLATSNDAEAVLRQLHASGLRGCGGAGFSTARKWAVVREQPAEEKFVVCNADESEPGTFKDRFLLERYPHLVIEGLVLAALVVGARKALVFLRHEYEAARVALTAALAAAQQLGAVGEAMFQSRHAVEVTICVSPGGYICGEESALLEVLEGRRAEPRNRPPFPASHGLWGQPTLINNVETLAWVPAIVAHGGDWFAASGLNGSAGLKVVALSGQVNRPGVYEIALGLRARDFIEQYGGGVRDGRRLKAFAPGGASAGFLPAALSNVPLAFEPLAAAGSMLGAGAVIVLAQGTCMVDAALTQLRFFRNESCGKCAPCRLGTQQLVDIVAAWTDGKAAPNDRALVTEVAAAMQATSICGLGQAAPNALLSVLAHFPEEVEAHLHGRCPEGVCP